MVESMAPTTRGYLLHLSHRDPGWFSRKAEEQPFDLETGMEVVSVLHEHDLNLLPVDCADAVG